MKKNKEIDPTFYENHCFGNDFYEAKKNGTLIVSLPGETALDAIKRYRKAQKEATIASRLPAGLADKGKKVAAAVL
jgi:hypothetical protein